GQIVCAALLARCDAVHPGYGFLSEQPALAEACAANNLVFVGPSADVIRRGGDKVAARVAARRAGVPVGAGSDTVATVDAATVICADVGFPVLLKAAAGGGGRGMVRVDDAAELASRFTVASNEALSAFGDGRLYIERFVENARHVEVQLLADSYGNVVHLGDRDCSLQRRYQKVLEEAPASALSDSLHHRLAEAAVALGRELDYVGAGTVEFLVDLDRGEFVFLEVNTRVQVEHPVTEMVTGIDIVREQLRIAAGSPLSFTQDDVVIRGHAIECRINAESVEAGFMPSPGRVVRWDPPAGPGIRLDTHVFADYDVPPFYDSLLAKLIIGGTDRDDAIRNLRAALAVFEVDGVDTTIELHRRIVDHPDFEADRVDTKWLERVLLATKGSGRRG
ncbi:MAG TPA: biotin carboxylase N-terminal domain-containing protein, partial [Ilumatobacteraceae bacterium]|nr:biotin carboxylase N-terminal domain-containing protein [Ilumatobacteraceae bacterium]